MKTRESSFGKAFLSKKRFALVEIAIVLCSVFLVSTLPAIAAEQTTHEVSAITTASEDETLEIYGNANEDDTIDMRDVTYIKLVIFGKKPTTTLADANNDGKVSMLDVGQTKLIILGKEKELTLIDSDGRIVTVEKPLKRIVAITQHLESLRAIKVEKDRIVGVESEVPVRYKIFFSEFSDYPTLGMGDPESIICLYPDVVLGSPFIPKPAIFDALESAGITVISLWAGVSCGAACENPEEQLLLDVKKLGYIFDKQDEAEELINWYEKNSLKEKVDEIPEEDKPKVYFEGSGKYTTSDDNSRAHVERAGGKNIFPEMKWASGSVDREAVAERNPDIIVKVVWADGLGYDLDAGDTAELEEVRDEIMSRLELQNVTAVNDGRVYVITGHLLWYGPYSGGRGPLQILYQTKWFHRELFKDLDPKAIHQEYLTRFQGLDIDLNEKGVFVYHPEEHPDGH